MRADRSRVPPPWEGEGWGRGEARRGAGACREQDRWRKRRALSFIVSTALLVIPLATGCRPSGEVFKDAPIVLISIDTLRSDHLPAYGYRKVETPAVDALRRDSILFERAYSHYPMTLPSHASILTGQLPPHHKVRDNVGYQLDGKAHPYLPRLLHEAGYATGAAVSAYVLRGGTGLSTGFDFYEDHMEPTPDQPLDSVQRPGSETARLAEGWLKERGDRPFFLFLHLYEPHAPYAPPEPYFSRYADKYDGEVAAADGVVGSFLAELKRLGIYDRAIVVLLSDHGEGLGEHGEQQHGIFLYRETLQVPLMVKLPGSRRADETVARPVALADVAPTLAALAGLRVPEGDGPGAMDGLSLLAPDPRGMEREGQGEREARQRRGEPAANGAQAERAIYSETFYPRLHLGWSDLASVITSRFHYIHGPDPELYDLGRDPGETRNLRAEARRQAAALRQEVESHDRRLAPPSAVDSETAGKLAALGYLGGPSVYREGPLPDPKSQRRLLAEIETAIRLGAEGRDLAAAAIYRRLVEANPGMLDMWAYLGMSLGKAGHKEEAARAFERALELSDGSPELALAAASALLQAGKLEEARQRAELAARADPRSANDLLSQIALAGHDLEGALALMKRAIDGGEASEALRRQYALTLAQAGRSGEALAALGPLAGSGDPASLNAVAVVLMRSGRLEEARQTLERALAAHPENPRIHELLGELALRSDRPAEAVQHLRRALALSEGLATAWNTLGVALYRTEGPAAAIEAWRRALALDPRQYEALLNVGLVAAEAGRRDEARQALRQFVATAPPARFGPDLEKARGLLRQLGG
jgi:choline-sulfatase